MAQDQQPVWLTQEAFDRLTAELEYLTGPWRIEIAKRIEAARSEGDLKENGGYHAAKDEQGKQEGRIRELQQLLRTAIVGEQSGDAGTVATGSLVTANVAGRELEFIVGNHEISAGADVKVFSEDSPLGEAIIGLTAGQTATYLAPNGKDISVEVLSVSRYHG